MHEACIFENDRSEVTSEVTRRAADTYNLLLIENLGYHLVEASGASPTDKTGRP